MRSVNPQFIIYLNLTKTRTHYPWSSCSKIYLPLQNWQHRKDSSKSRIDHLCRFISIKYQNDETLCTSDVIVVLKFFSVLFFSVNIPPISLSQLVTASCHFKRGPIITKLFVELLPSTPSDRQVLDIMANNSLIGNSFVANTKARSTFSLVCNLSYFCTISLSIYICRSNVVPS